MYVSNKAIMQKTSYFKRKESALAHSFSSKWQEREREENGKWQRERNKRHCKDGYGDDNNASAITSL